MREIKFRAWLKGTHDNITFTEPIMEYNITVSNGVYADVESGWDIQGHYPTIPIMQFTGLKAKNGKEIYEGDIFHCNNVNYVLKYEILGGAYTVHNIKDDTDERFLHHCNHQIEVIGNIHENPELLSTPTAVL